VKLRLGTTKGFPQEALDPIPGDSIADLAAHRQTKTRMPASVLPDQEEQMRAMSFFCLGEDLREFLFAP
jgi:hypothetical protein